MTEYNKNFYDSLVESTQEQGCCTLQRAVHGLIGRYAIDDRLAQGFSPLETRSDADIDTPTEPTALEDADNTINMHLDEWDEKEWGEADGDVQDVNKDELKKVVKHLLTKDHSENVPFGIIENFAG